jgi:hypothetical protein
MVAGRCCKRKQTEAAAWPPAAPGSQLHPTACIDGHMDGIHIRAVPLSLSCAALLPRPVGVRFVYAFSAVGPWSLHAEERSRAEARCPQ